MPVESCKLKKRKKEEKYREAKGEEILLPLLMASGNGRKKETT